VKILIIILSLLCVEVYSQSFRVAKTDSDSLWQEFKWVYPEIVKEEYTVKYDGSDNTVIFYSRLWCSMEELREQTKTKIKNRIGHINDRQ